MAADSHENPLHAARQSMVRDQLVKRGIADRPVLNALARVPRERFVPTSARQQAYADNALAIECGQTISQPFIVALMTQALGLTGREKVLEIGTGSGYQTAVLAELAGQVYTIERHAELAATAQQVLADLGYTRVAFRVGDGTLGWPEAAPFDRILVAAAADRYPPALFEQLAESGLLVMPVGDPESQVLQAVRKVSGQPQVSELSPCRFVPLIGEQGREDET